MSQPCHAVGRFAICHRRVRTQADKDGKRAGGVGFLDRALREAKRLGEAIDPDAAAQVRQAWKVREAFFAYAWIGLV